MIQTKFSHIKTHVLLISTILLISASAHAQKSTKGNWTSSDKYSVIAELNAQREVFEAFLDSTLIDPLIDCIADELEATYENPDSVKTNSPKMQEISVYCLDAVGFKVKAPQPESTSIEGMWNEQDLNAAYQNLEYTRDVMQGVLDSAQLNTLFDCVVTKLEANYPNFDAAINDPSDGISKLTLACIEEYDLIDESALNQQESMIQESKGDPNSEIGNWSDDDKAKLEKELEEMRSGFESKLGQEGTNSLYECVRFNFEYAFESYADINNHPNLYKAILDECYQKQLKKD